MKLCLNTDGLGFMPFEEMLSTSQQLGFLALEIACGNWSGAPHINIDELLGSKDKRDAYIKAIRAHGLDLDALNCSGNQLDPNDDGKRHQEVVEKTFQLAEHFGVKKIVMMSGLPGGSPDDNTANWITMSWPPSTTKILNWQWNEVLIPYWEKTVKLAKSHGIEQIALENHGSQMVYNPETFLRLREAVGPMIGINLDPSHLIWMGGDPIAAAIRLGYDNIYHVHAKDVRLEQSQNPANGPLDTKTIDKFATRSWNFVALGFGRDVRWWKEFFAVLNMLGYNGTVSLEMEDMTMPPLVGIKKSVKVLKEALPHDFD